MNNRLHAALFILGLILLSVGCTAAQGTSDGEKWYEYEPRTVVLSGTLIEAYGYGPPNYGENPETDKRETYYMVKLVRPISIKGNPQSDTNTDTITGVTKIQLELIPSTNLHDMVGKKMKVRGTLFQAILGRHYTAVILRVHGIGDIELITQRFKRL